MDHDEIVKVNDDDGDSGDGDDDYDAGDDNHDDDLWSPTSDRQTHL